MGGEGQQAERVAVVVHHRHRVDLASVDTADRDRAAAAHRLDHGVQGVQPVQRGFVGHLDRRRVGQQPGRLLRQFGQPGRAGLVVAVRFHPDRVDHRIRPPAVHRVDQGGRGVVHADHTLHPAAPGDPRGQRPDRPQAQHGQGAAGGNVRVGRRRPGS
jgi:hypothetical protein